MQNRLFAFLDDSRVRYRVSRSALATPLEEREQDACRLGLGLVEASLWRVDDGSLVVTVVPASHRLLADEFCRLFSPRHIADPGGAGSPPSLPEQPPGCPIFPFGTLYGAETYLSPVIEPHHQVGFFIDDGRTLVTLSAADYRRLVQASKVSVPTGTRYRAYAAPGRESNEDCILGVSLESADFHTPKLATIVEWIARHHRHCQVMIGDGLHRITLQMDQHLPEDEALEYSKWLARDFAFTQRAVFKRWESECEFRFVYCSEIQERPEYLGFLRQLSDLYRADADFRRSFGGFSQEFLQRKPQRRSNASEHAAMSCQYLLEELAVLSCLSQDRPWTFVYPGSLTILAEIAEGLHPGIPAGLARMDYVELKLKSR